MHPMSAYLSLHLDGVQARLGIEGPLVEIGVYHGKYFALLYRMARGADLVGVDINFCETGHETAAWRALERLFGDVKGVRLIAADSWRLAPSDFPSGVRFVSVDGSHEARVVEHDLGLAEAMLCAGGIVALDDAFNCATPGVTQAVCTHLGKGSGLAPFAQCHNKLFLTTADYHERYLDACHAFIRETPWAPGVRETTQRIENQRRDGFTPSFYGYAMIGFL
jgi:hypothetical protein